MADVVGGKAMEAVVTNVTDRAVDSVWRQVGYVWNYKSNIRDLENKLKIVKAERESMKHSMDEAVRKLETVEEAATIWCENADAAIRVADDLLAEHGAANKSCFMGYCPNLKPRHQFSRKAIKETIPALSKVQLDRSSISRISHPMDVQQLERPTNYQTLGSRMEIMEQVLGALKSSDVNLVGVYGFSGVGKSTMVKQQVVANVKEKNIFKVVVVANVTHSWSLSKIQQEIADWLHLDLSPGSTEVRATKLYARLKQEEKVLIILDDIWEKIPLEEIGIPETKDHKGCKLLMTSRDLNILSKMGVQKHFHLPILEEDEAWQLFKTKAGDFRIPRTQPIAHEVAKRCLGLPVLIVAVATSLRDKELYEWIDALEKLQNFDHKEMNDKVYSALELSCNYLEYDAKSLLVLFAQLPSSMLISDLVKFAIGLELFNNCKTVSVVRNRLLKVVNDLKNSCLLLEDVNELHVRIHNVVHSFVAKLASKEHHVFTSPSKSDLEEWPEEHKLEQCTAISLPYCKIPQLPEVLECPELESFLLLNDDLSLKITENFFSRTKKLKLVGLLGGNILLVLPSSLGFLKNLQTLCLHGCVLEDTRTIGVLQKLRVLSFNSSSIVRLPMEISNLTCLQFLDLSRCEQLKVVPPGILNCLTNLEELCMLGTIVHWESEELKNASLSELKSLSNLINLEIHIVDAKMFPADLFHKKLERFKIFIGGGWCSLGEHIPSKLLKLKLNSGAELQRVKVLLAATENLHLDDVKGVKNVVPQLERRGFPELQELFVQRCNEMERIVDDKRMRGTDPFSSSSFSNLKKLNVGHCNALRYLFSFSMFKCLTQLQELCVSYCQNLEMIVGYENGDDDSDDAIIKLTHLVKMVLRDLPGLACFGSPTANMVFEEIIRADEFGSLFTKKIQFPNLEKLELSSLKVKKIWNDQCIELCPFEKLKSLVIRGCGHLAHVLTSSMVRSLAQLKEFVIEDCKSMVEVISRSTEVEHELDFCSLLDLHVLDLPKVEKFCTSSMIRCPSLEELIVFKCPRLHTFVSVARVGVSDEACQQDSALFDEKIEFPNLERLVICGPTGLKAIWNNELHENSFHKLKLLLFNSATEMIKIFPSNCGMKRFQNLEELLIRDCDAVTEVFEIGELVDDVEADVVNSQLRTLDLRNLPNLKHIWRKDPKGLVKFEQLRHVFINGCGCLKTVFPSSVAKGLVHLEKLEIYDSGIEQIVGGDGEELDGEAVYEFPMLTSLVLRRLSQLVSLCPATNPLELPALRRFLIVDCKRFPKSILSQDKIYPNLEELTLYGKEIEMIRQGQLQKSNFLKLKAVELNFHKDDSCSFPFDLLHMFDNLETLQVSGGNFKELFPIEGLADDEKHQMIWANIRSLKLHSVLFLKTLCNGELQALERLLVYSCDNLINLAPSSASFKCLASLEIDQCGGLLSLVTASTAKSFAQLKTLRVASCDQLKVVVSDEGDETTGEITFNQLQTLELESLPSLTIFSSACHEFKFPCLIHVGVTQCPNMELFSKGFSTTPLLQHVEWSRAGYGEEWFGDLNSTISLCYRKMVGLQWMQHLKVSEHPNVKNRWNSRELPVEFLSDLESLVVDDIAISSYAVPSNLLDFLNQLEKLEVSNSEVVEEVFDVQIGSGAECGLTDLLSFLESIHLINLPRLRNIWNVGILKFKKLNSLKVHHCSSLKTILTPSVAEEFVQLQEIEVKYCDSVEEIISKGAGSEVESEIVFPMLQSMKLESLPALASLNGGSKVLKCPSLEQIEIADCPATFTLAFLRQLQLNTFEQTTEPTIQLSNLTKLRFSSIYLGKIWHSNGLEFSLYGKLTSLAINGCGNLSFALTPSMVRNLAQLETLEICDCKSIEEVVSTEEETEEEMEFPKLIFLKIKGLLRVVKFCTSNLLQCPSLEKLYIENCPQLQRFLSTCNNAGQQDSILFDEKVEFPNLEVLKIVGVNELEGVWDSELLENSFKKLNYVNLGDAKKIVRIFPPNLLRRFKNFEKLYISGCDAIKEVFDIKALRDLEERGGVVVTQLKRLWVCNTPNLLHVWNEDPNGILDFANLKLVDIRGCSSLKSVFPASVARQLVHLEELYIRGSEIRHIIAPDQEKIEGASVFKFHKLEHINLRDLPHLKRLYAFLNTSELPALKELFVTHCSKLLRPALLYKKAIPSLKHLALNGKEVLMIRQGELAVDSFHKLKCLELNFDDDSSAIFPFDLFHIFHNLETLCVVHSKFVELFPRGGSDGDPENQCQNILSKIHSLELRALPNLTTFWNEVLETLEALYVRECGSLIILTPPSASFQNLSSLSVVKCMGLVSLVASSTARSLLRLKTLTVSDCNELKTIVSDDDEHENETDEIILLKLQTLEFDCLSSLSSFCCGNHSFRFPSLVKVIVKQCPNMEFFTKGVSTTPKLQRVKLEKENSWYWLGNLNSTVRFLHEKTDGLHGLRHLKVSEYLNLKNRWNGELPVELLSNLESLVVDDIAVSSYAVPSNLLEFLNQLKKLVVSNSEVVEEVFDVQIGSGAECGRTNLLSFLKSIHLINLPRLRNIWNVGILNFKRLNSLKVHHCSSLKTILTLPVAEGLVQLQEIEVKYCDSVEEIISKGAGSEVESEIIFPMLQSMKLESLPALVSLNGGSKVLKCPSLEQIEIADCPATFTRIFLRKLQSNASEQTTELEIQLSNLTKLRFSSIYLEKIWHSNGLEFSLYATLTSLAVDGCGNLSYALTSLMVRNLSQLETLEICDCKSIEEVISTEAETEEEIAFPKLRVLKMKGLLKVVKFCTSNLLQCPSLKGLHIEDCPRLERFLSDSNEDGKQDTTLFDEKVDFPNLDYLVIVGVNELEGVWDSKLTQDSFSKLKHLSVIDAKKIMRIFPSNLVIKFKDLETLYMHGCDAIKEVFDIKALIDLKERGGVVFTQLKKLWVYNNTNLLHVWNVDPNGILGFENISFMDIRGCPSLKCVFPASVARGLVHLEELIIWDSGILHIIAPDQEENKSAVVFTFDRLKDINLRRLSQLERLCSGMHTTELPALKNLFVTECSKLQQPALLYQKAIPSLGRLALNGKEVSMIRGGELAVDMFHQLKYLELNFYDDSSAAFPFDLFHIFHNLEALSVACSKFSDLFPPEGPDVDHENQCRTVLKKIYLLELHVLPNLKTFWNELLGSLEILFMRECDSLINLAPCSAVFHNLTSLSVFKCMGLVSLVTSSTARSLLRLKNLTVSECDELKGIVSDDDKHGKVMYEIIFLKLEILIFDRLSSLSSFCCGNHNFKFPSLEEVILKQCPNMEFFTKGVSTTPKLQRVKLEKENSWYWLGNLNSTVRFLHKKTIAKKVEEH